MHTHTIQYNHHNKRDVALFDFTSIHQTEHAAKAVKKGGKVLYLCLAGDSLLEVRHIHYVLGVIADSPIANLIDHEDKLPNGICLSWSFCVDVMY